MLIGTESQKLLKKTQSKAKMYEYSVALDQHIAVDENVKDLLLLTISAIGNISAHIINKEKMTFDKLVASKSDLKFCAKFFDAYANSKLNYYHNDYYNLLGAISYYLCDYIGGAKVLAKRIAIDDFELQCNDIDKALLWLLIDDTRFKLNIMTDKPYYTYLQEAQKNYLAFFRSGERVDITSLVNLRNEIYDTGTPRELLFCDAFFAIYLLKLKKSALSLLPQFTSVTENLWIENLLAKPIIKELWPSQIRLGEIGVFDGKSAVIQMPTSSGKTKSLSILIKASFLSNRTNDVIIVAPLKALCREIKEDIAKDFNNDKNVKIGDLTDIPELEDFYEIFQDATKHIIILTPEKLVYLLRQDNSFISKIKLIIFDEGHLFDDENRGANYELLIATVLQYIDKDTQKVLISAVIPNAHQLNAWLNKKEGVVLSDNTIKATEKTIAFFDWHTYRNDPQKYGYLHFVNPENPEEEEFYVPRIGTIKELVKKNGEWKRRFFPDENEAHDIAILKAISVCNNGATAIFCGKKDSVNKILNRFQDIKNRGIDISSFYRNCNANEMIKLINLIEENYGTDNIFFQSAKDGIFAHHADIAYGIKLSIEYAIKNNLIPFIICTSTLAQGVNLPIRYLIISGIYQAGEQIKVREFHNLIGRAGRAGIHTEGTIIFSEPDVHKLKNYKWDNYKKVLNPNNSENCESRLLMLIRPQLFEKKIRTRTFNGYKITTYKLILDFMKVAEKYFSDREQTLEELTQSKQNLYSNYPKDIVDNYFSAYNKIFDCVSTIESFIFPILGDSLDESLTDINKLIEQSFAYSLANEEEKENLTKLFFLISNYLYNNTISKNERIAFGKTMLPLTVIQNIQKWVNDNLEKINSCETTKSLFDLLSPLLFNIKSIEKIEQKEEISQLGRMWIEGKSYYEIENYAKKQRIQKNYRKSLKLLDINDIVNLCNDGFGYSALIIVNAVLEMLTEKEDRLVKLFKLLEKQMRYGLEQKEEIVLYEKGLSDRFIVQKISKIIGNEFSSHTELKARLLNEEEHIKAFLSAFPTVFTERFTDITN